MSRQVLDVRIERRAALCYLPDPNVPYKDSRYEQVQTFTVDWEPEGNNRSSLCVLDWVTEGRTALGEKWDFQLWRGKNEVWTLDGTGGKKLLLRDSIILDAESEEQAGETCTGKGLIRQRTGANSIIGTLILYGPVFERLAAFFIHRFQSQPRIGSQNWSSSSHKPTPLPSDESDVVWTAARVRVAFVIVKFGARDVNGAKRWLGDLLREEGSIAEEFGEEALLCL
jgi:urease accessory protein